jgi:RND family efflux transporter MFP subunit
MHATRLAQRRIVATSTVLVVAGFTFPGCGGSPDPEPVIRPVRYLPVYESGGRRVRTFSGVAKSSEQTSLSFKVGGTIQELPARVGNQVQAGQLVAALDPTDSKLQVEEARAALQRAQAEARKAEADYRRVQALYENRNASRNDLDAARTGSESSKAAVTGAEKQLELANRQLAYTRLSAPVAGAIASVPVALNENVGLGQTIAVLESGARAEVDVGIPEMLISRIREGEKVSVRFDALPGREFMATITEVGVASTTRGATYPVVVQLDSSDENVRSGMAAEVAFQFMEPEARSRIYVPPVAVGEDRSGRFVFVVQRDESDGKLGTAQRRDVRVGDLTQEGLEVLEGLQDGDLLVTAGVSRIADGQSVRLLEEHQDGP